MLHDQRHLTQVPLRMILRMELPHLITYDERRGRLVRQHVKRVVAGRNSQPFEGDGLRGRDDRRFIRAGHPPVSPRHESAPDLATALRRTAVVEGDVAAAGIELVDLVWTDAWSLARRGTCRPGGERGDGADAHKRSQADDQS